MNGDIMANALCVIHMDTATTTETERMNKPQADELPLVSIIIPCRNERQFIGRCLDSIIESDYSADKLDVVVVDGMSEDGTRDVLRDYNRRFSWIRFLDNERRITPVAFNIGIHASHGDPILIMSSHAAYAPDAIRKLVTYAAQYNASNVGGIWKIVPRDSGPVAKAIAAALSHRFGVGNATYRTSQESSEPRWVDTAAYGCYRREVFSQIGTFNEELVCTQDMDLNRRLMSAGGKTLLAPDVVIYYFARTRFRNLSQHNFRNGLWVILPFAYTKGVPVAPRHLVPCIFVASLLLTLSLVPLAGVFGRLFLTIVAAYALAGTCATIQVSVRERDPRFLVLLPIIFAVLHLSYGWGSICGLWRLLWLPRFWRKCWGSCTE